MSTGQPEGHRIVVLDCEDIGALPLCVPLPAAGELEIRPGTGAQMESGAVAGHIVITLAARGVRDGERLVLTGRGARSWQWKVDGGSIATPAGRAEAGGPLPALFGWNGHLFVVCRGGAAGDGGAGLSAGPIEILPGQPNGVATFNSVVAAQLGSLERIARAALPVLITGETGTGKELVTRVVHQLSGRRGRLVPVDCGALAPGLVHSQLFGHVRGSFSGATADHSGFIRDSDGGTLFLDEIGELPLELQPLLLRVLQERQVVPLGSVRAFAVDLRVVSATNQDLRALVERGRFRRDLYARLSGYLVELPPLRERPEDIPLLVQQILRRLIPDRARRRLTMSAAMALFGHSWPMNIRELDHCLAAAVSLAGDGAIDVQHLGLHTRSLPNDVQARAGQRRARTAGADVTCQELRHLLEVHGGNVAAVARSQGKARMQVHRWLRRHGLDPNEFRDAPAPRRVVAGDLPR